ncbi:MAG TPA: hemerythrin domain-containing protein [Rhodanobacteraceae bacterium]|nr:hemerythrin domain-containing protein [Rhodanobacteraceae bacterium]
MGFFGKLFGKGSQETVLRPTTLTVDATSVPRRIGYDPALVQNLLHDHTQLGLVYSQIGDADQAGNLDEVRRLLAVFKSRLEAHVLAENVRFYNYLEQSIHDDATNTELMRGFRREMNEIVRQVLAFVRKYLASDLPPAARRAFAVDYAAMREVLEHRFDSEEGHLYPLYQPASH